MFGGKQSLNFVQSEIHNVLSTLRRNGRWASVDRFTREIPLQFETPLVRSFKQLHDILQFQASQCQREAAISSPGMEPLNAEEELGGITDLDCLTFLQPFLDVILSPNTNATMTGRALSSINKFLLYGLIKKSSLNVKQAINLSVCSIVECQFESNNVYSDEVVLMQILEVLVNLIRCEAGYKITNQNVWKIIHTCYKIKTEADSSTLLKSTAGNSLTHIILTIFTRARKLITQKTLTEYLTKLKRQRSMSQNPESRRESTENVHKTLHLHLPQPSAASRSVQKPQDLQMPQKELSENVTSAPQGSVVQGSQPDSEKIEPARRVENDEQAEIKPYGLPVMIQLLKFLSSLTDVSKNSSNTRAFALQLINIILETAGASLSLTLQTSSHPPSPQPPVVAQRSPLESEENGNQEGYGSPIISILQGNLCKFLLQNSQSDDLMIVSLTLRVVFNLFNAMKGHLKVQLEVFLISIHLRLACINTGTTSLGAEPKSKESSKKQRLNNELKELALESLLDFCREPTMMLDLYINYDCDFNCTNLFETLIRSLCKCAVPPSHIRLLSTLSQAQRGSPNGSETGARREGEADGDGMAFHSHRLLMDENAVSMSVLNSLNLIALEGILAVIDQLANLENVNNFIEKDQTEQVEDVEADSHSELSYQLKQKKELKRKLLLCAKEFNKKPHKYFWLKYAQDLDIIPTSMAAEHVFQGPKDSSVHCDPDAVALFFLTTPGLDKGAVGDFLGDGPKEEKPLNNEVLLRFMKKMNLRGMRIDEAIRKVLKKFRLPGEAQKIDRIMESFGNELYNQNTLKAEESERTMGSHGDQSEQHKEPAKKEKEREAETREVKQPLTEQEKERAAVYNVFENADAAFTLSFSIIMLHTDLHNSAIKPEKKMTLEQFIRNNRGINDGKDFNPLLLEKIYHKTKIEQMKMLYNPNDLSRSHDTEVFNSWENVLKHSEKVDKAIITNFKTNMKYKGLMKDMYEIIYDQFVASMMCVLELTRDGKVVFKVLNGFLKLVAIASYFELEVNINYILVTLSNYFCSLSKSLVRVNEDNVLEEEAVGLQLMKKLKYSLRYSKTTVVEELEADESRAKAKKFEKLELYGSSPICKCLLVFNAVVTMAKNYGTYLNEAWLNIIRGILVINEYDLLPSFFIELDDIIDLHRRGKRSQSVHGEAHSGSRGATTGNRAVTFAATQETRKTEEASDVVQPSSPNGGSFWGMLTSFLFSEEHSPQTNRNEGVVVVMKDLMSMWDLRVLFSNSKNLRRSSLVKLIEALTVVTTFNQGNDRGDNEERNIILCLELLTEVAISLSSVSSRTGTGGKNRDEKDYAESASKVDQALKTILIGFYKTIRLGGVVSDKISLPSMTGSTTPAISSSATNVDPNRGRSRQLNLLIVERVVINLLGVSMRMLDHRPDIQQVVLHSLTWIVHLPKELAQKLSKKVGMGLGTVLTLNHSALMKSEDSATLKKLFDILSYYSQFDLAVDHIYNAFAQVVIRQKSELTSISTKPLVKSDSYFELFLDFIDQFIVNGAGETPEEAVENLNDRVLPALPVKRTSLSLFNELNFNYDYQDLLNSVVSRGRADKSVLASPNSLISHDSFGFESDFEEKMEGSRSEGSSSASDVAMNIERRLWSEIRAAKSCELVVQLLLNSTLISASKAPPTDLFRSDHDAEDVKTMVRVLKYFQKYQQDSRRIVRVSVKKSFEIVLLRLTNAEDTLYRSMSALEKSVSSTPTSLTRLSSTSSLDVEADYQTFVSRLCFMSATAWTDLFIHTLIDLVPNDIQVPESFSAQILEQLALESVFGYTKLLINCFLQRIHLLSTGPDFSLLWLKIIQCLCKNLKVSQTVVNLLTKLKNQEVKVARFGLDRALEVKETCDKIYYTSVEAFKNLIMVLRLELKLQNEEEESNLMKLTFDLIHNTSADVKAEVVAALEACKTIETDATRKQQQGSTIELPPVVPTTPGTSEPVKAATVSDNFSSLPPQAFSVPDVV